MNFTFGWFEVHTPFWSCFCPLKFFVDEKCFCGGKFLLGLFSLFYLCKMFFHTRKNVYQDSHLLKNAEPRRCGPFRSKMEVKRSKVFAEGFFYSCFLILFFTIEWCVDSPKIFLPSFKTVRHSWRDFFQKSDGRRRSKEDFLLRSTWWVHVP